MFLGFFLIPLFCPADRSFQVSVFSSLFYKGSRSCKTLLHVYGIRLQVHLSVKNRKDAATAAAILENHEQPLSGTSEKPHNKVQSNLIATVALSLVASMGGWRPLPLGWEAIALGLETIALWLEAIALRMEAIALRLEAVALRLEAIALRLEAIANILKGTVTLVMRSPLLQETKPTVPNPVGGEQASSYY